MKPWEESWGLSQQNIRKGQQLKMLNTFGLLLRIKYTFWCSPIYHPRFCVEIESRSPGSQEKSRHFSVRETLPKTEKDRQSQRHQTIQRDKGTSTKSWKLILLEVCWQYHRGGGSRAGIPTQAEEVLVLYKVLRKYTGGVAPLKENGKLHADPNDKADILNCQYESTWTKEDRQDIPTPDGEPFPSMKGIHVTTEGVVKLLQKLNPGKACGPYLLPARVLRGLAIETSPYLTIIFQRSFETGYVTKDKRTANVTRLFLRKESNSRPATTDLSSSPAYAVKYRNMW